MNEGVVLASDIFQDPSQEPNINKITDQMACLLVDDLAVGKIFLDNHVIPYANGNQSFDEIGKEAARVLRLQPSPFQGQIFTAVFVGYGSNFQDRPFIIMRFDGQQAGVKVIRDDVIFSFDDQLGKYLSSKVFSRLMSLESACRLMTFILAQYNLILPVRIGKQFRLATISKQGYKELTAQELDGLTATSRNADLELRKACSSLFIPESANE